MLEAHLYLYISYLAFYLFNAVFFLTYIRVAQTALMPGIMFHAANSLMHIPKLPSPTPPHSAAATATMVLPCCLPDHCAQKNAERTVQTMKINMSFLL